MANLPNVVAEQANQDSATGVSTAFTIVSVILVGLRVYTRTVLVHNFGKDDFMMLLALLFTIAYLVAIYILRQNGMGFSGLQLTPVQMVNLIQATLGIQMIYYALIFCIKVSILFFYLRIASQKRFAMACRYTIYLLAVFFIVCEVCTVTQCIPIHKMWDFTGKVAGHCINTTAFFYTTSSFNIVTDIWIIALPIRPLMAIQRPTREKVALIVVFSLGVFSCIASIIRLHSIRIYTQSKDPFYDSVPVNLWSQIEVNIGIWCACIPALKAMFIRSQRERTRNGSNYKYQSKISGRTNGSTSNDGLHGTAQYNMQPVPGLQQPEQATVKASHIAERSRSTERFFYPDGYMKV